MLLSARGAGVRRWLGESGFCKLASSVGFEEFPRGAREALQLACFSTMIVLLGTSPVSASEIRQVSRTDLLSVPVTPGKAEGSTQVPPWPTVLRAVSSSDVVT